MKRLHFLTLFIPSDKWKLVVILLLGILSGLIFFLFYVSKAVSYLSDDSKTCVNCHIMTPQYATWQHSSHRQWTNCNDCHVPHNNVFNKYFFKAKDGIRHATIFTLRNEPQVIMIHEAGQEVVHQNCIRCHEKLLDVHASLSKSQFLHTRTDRKCWDCHREVPHGRVNSLSSTPYARVPLPESPVPQWIKNRLETNINTENQ